MIIKFTAREYAPQGRRSRRRLARRLRGIVDMACRSNMTRVARLHDSCLVRAVRVARRPARKGGSAGSGLGARALTASCRRSGRRRDVEITKYSINHAKESIDRRLGRQGRLGPRQSPAQHRPPGEVDRQARLDHRDSLGDMTAGLQELDEVDDFHPPQSAAVAQLRKRHVPLRHVAEDPPVARVSKVRGQFGPGGEAVLFHGFRGVGCRTRREWQRPGVASGRRSKGCPFDRTFGACVTFSRTA